ncbi:MAG: hypothetical protein K2V38_00525, partial [Gemmataceae bacterium]|nr:hypothetical protein [Gemmataceae bacterium]
MSAAYGLIFILLAVCALAPAALTPWWALRAVGAAGALSFLLVGVAYLGAGPRFLFKRADGQRHPLAWAVHWPYFTLTALSYRLTVRFYREVAYVRVAPNVLLGRRLTAAEARAATGEGWVAVLDL